MEYFDIVIILLSFFALFFFLFRDKNGLPTNWPLLGMLPGILVNVNRMNDLLIQAMEKSQMTSHLKCPLFTNMNILITVDPASVQHVFSKNFGNYIKGPKFYEIFEVLGYGIFNADFSLWQYHRKLSHSFFNNPKFNALLAKTIWEEIREKLFPVLDHVSQHAIEIDLLDLFKRFTYDSISTIVLDHDPKFLSLDFQPIPLSKALSDIQVVVYKRHVVPKCLWKFLRWLGVGEKKYKNDCETLDKFTYKCIANKREERRRCSRRRKEPKEDIIDHDEVSTDLLTLYLDEEESGKLPINDNGDKFVRDAMLSYFVAGGDSTSIAFSWFFYLLLQNPRVVVRIREEVNAIMSQSADTNDGFLRSFIEHDSELVYLHAALCETLRLYPPLIYNHKCALKSDILPSGHRVNPNMPIIFDMYAMGRMKSIWGDDCNEFKPERWITERGNIKLEPSYKLLAFGSGPRMCQGKDMVLTEIKFVVAAILQKYHMEAVEGHRVVPEASMMLQMKHGFKVKIIRS